MRVGHICLDTAHKSESSSNSSGSEIHYSGSTENVQEFKTNTRFYSLNSKVFKG